MVLLSLLAAALLSPARAVAVSPDLKLSFDSLRAEVRPAPPPTVAELIDTLRSSRDRSEQRKAIDSLVWRAAVMDASDALLTTAALEDAASSSLYAEDVRAKALYGAGQCAAWFKDETAFRRATMMLADWARFSDADSRSRYRPYALKGLAEAAGRLDSFGASAAEEMLTAAFDVLELTERSTEKVFAALFLEKVLSHRGAWVMQTRPELSRRFADEVFRPIESNVEAFVGSSENTPDYRYLMMRCLRFAAWNDPYQPDLRWRAKQLFYQLSEREREPRLRQLARMYHDSIRS